MTQASIQVPIIGVHHSPLMQKFGIPRQPNLVSLPSQIELFAPYSTPDAFVGLSDFSHLWIHWQFHKNKPQTNFRPQVRPPRLGGNDKLGVFATRSMYRPSGLGLSVVQLEKITINQGQSILHILGADMIDGTPIIDIKPYVAYSDSHPNALSGFATTPPLQKRVIIESSADKTLTNLLDDDIISKQDITYIQDLISHDPRPAYRQQELTTTFAMQYRNIDVIFYMNSNMDLVIKNIQLIT